MRGISRWRGFLWTSRNRTDNRYQITHTFMRSIIVLPPELSNSLMECATRAVSLQERYSLVAGCKFLVNNIYHSSVPIVHLLDSR